MTLKVAKAVAAYGCRGENDGMGRAFPVLELAAAVFGSQAAALDVTRASQEARSSHFGNVVEKDELYAPGILTIYFPPSLYIRFMRSMASHPPAMPHAELSKPLSAEPSRPKDRRAKGLQPKSYEDAAKEGLPNGTHDGRESSKAQREPLVKRQQPDDAVNGITQSIANLNNDAVFDHERPGLTSVKEPEGYYVGLQQYKKERPSPNQNMPHKDELKSGRRAGQRWHQSAYVEVQPLHEIC